MLLMCALAKAALGQSGAAVLDANTVLLVGPEEPGPIHEAAQDLATDFEKVFGRKPRIVHEQREAAPVTVLIGFRSDLVKSIQPSGLDRPESFSISVGHPNWKGGAPAKVVLLTGADMRGTMFAVYQFSEEYLGVDPLYYWTDHKPAARAEIELPANLNKTFAPPVFKYRGLFINDEDLLTGWAPGAGTDATGISLEVWNKIYETILRLKGNIVAPGTWIFPDEPQVRLAGKRGLIITQHHAIPLGLNVARWPKDVPYSYSSNPEVLERAWKDAVKAYPPGQEILWTVGLRGLSDVSYAAFDPSVRNNDQALGSLIGKAINAQMRIVRSLRPDASFITNLWQEGARLAQDGYLSIPRDVNVVWADDGYGNLQDHGDVAAGQGAYYHVAMMNGRANQLTEMVPVQRIAAELGRYIHAGATHYLLLNTSDIRPVSMTTKAVMDIAWKGLTPETSDDRQFYRRWSAAEFGDKAADKIAAIYKDYFDAPARTGGEHGREYGDQYYHTESRLLLLSYMIAAPLYAIPSQAPLWVAPRVMNLPAAREQKRLVEMAKTEAERCEQAQPRWDSLWSRAMEAEQLVAPERRPFYRAHVLAMIAIAGESNRILALTGEAVQDAAAANRAGARAAVQRALQAVAAIQKAEAAAEYGQWRNWYRGDWLTNVSRTAELLKSFSKLLDDPLGPLPPPIVWNGWEAYHHITQYQGSRTADVN
jgi:hypothetical protein